MDIEEFENEFWDACEKAPSSFAHDEEFEEYIETELKPLWLLFCGD